MDESDRLNLQRMIASNDVEDYTQHIRNKKHSQLIKKDVQKLLNLMKTGNSFRIGKDDFDILCVEECSFLFNNYTDIFNKIKKSELDLNIFSQFLDVLYLIEEGKMDQHEGSFHVGTILKKLYIDSALKRTQRLDEEAGGDDGMPELVAPEPKVISWNQWKHMKQD